MGPPPPPALVPRSHGRGAAALADAASGLESRAARARFLAASRSDSAAEQPLRFAAGLYDAQAEAARGIAASHARSPLSGRLQEDAVRVIEPAARVLAYAAAEGPDPLASAAGARRDEDPGTARTRLLVYWSGDAEGVDAYLSRAVLRPYAEVLRAIPLAPGRVHKQGRCPFCGGPPWISARREGSLMEGAKRMLGCALCGGEWAFGRILCPSCLEGEPAKLPHFSSDAYPAARIEACETCRRYVKSLDLSEDARPIPEVDDLLSLALDLWAAEQGFTRIEPGLAGV